jgi:hypothetical protein
MLLNEHGSFMVGVDYTDQYFSLPLHWFVIVSFRAWRPSLSSAINGKSALFVVLALLVRATWFRPSLTAVYVRPNEISLERPFIARHIEATRSAFGFDQRTMTEIEVEAKPEQHHRCPMPIAPCSTTCACGIGTHSAPRVSQIQPLPPLTYTKIRRRSLHVQRRNAAGSGMSRASSISVSLAMRERVGSIRISSTRTATAS